VLDFLRRLRRASVLEQELPEALRTVIADNVPLYSALTPDERHKLERLTLLFLSEKSFEGAGGLILTDEMRVVIAARACLVVLFRVELDEPLYPDLDSIVVYPSAYRGPGTRREGAVVVEDESVRLGESWTRGTVVLSWQAVQVGGQNDSDGHDVVVHEFAHQLDGEDGTMDGAPSLDRRAQYDSWARVLGAEYEALSARVERGKKTDLDPYGATAPAEFFAVITEQFFERPVRLRARHPELYEELSTFYHFDPAARLA